MIRLLVLFFFTALFHTITYAGKQECVQRHCVAVIDAGSTGSRLHVYAYDLDSTHTPIHIDEIWNRKALPGLSTIEHEHGSISAYMEKLFTDAPTAIMPVYFYSTAGMRLLPKTHHKNINQLVADWFDKQYYWRLSSARTITGSEEGLFAWLATNYQLNLLNQTEKPLVGVMDIGGASVQIIFPLINEEGINSNDKETIDLYGHQYTIFSHSFLGLGQNEMGHQYYDVDDCYSNNYDLPSGTPGKGNADSCVAEISTLVNGVHYVKRKIKGVLSHNPVETWYLLGGVTNLLNDKFFAFSNAEFTPQELKSLADKQVCTEDWSTLEAKYPDNFMLFNYCMLPSYVYALTVNGYGLQPNQTIKFLPLNKNVDWTIGVVLQHQKT